MSAPDDREPLDFDRVHEATMAIAGGVLYLLGAVGGLLALCWYVHPAAGFAWALVAGLVPSAYSVRKAAERRAERERAAHFRAQQERTAAASDVPILG